MRSTQPSRSTLRQMPTNLPNLLTLFRIAVIPGLVALFYIETKYASWLACGLFSLAAITDFFDGYFARMTKQQSAFGKFLDPVADKLLVSSALLMMVAFGQINGLEILPALVILCREITVSGLREYLASLRVSMPVSQLAKWKTTLQMVAIAVLIVGDTGPRDVPLLEIGVAGLWVAAILTIITGYDYLRAGLRHIEREDSVDEADDTGFVSGGNAK